MNEVQWEVLVEAVRERTATEQQQHEFAEILRQDEQRRRAYVQDQLLHHDLSMVLAESDPGGLVDACDWMQAGESEPCDQHIEHKQHAVHPPLGNVERSEGRVRPEPRTSPPQPEAGRPSQREGEVNWTTSLNVGRGLHRGLLGPHSSSAHWLRVGWTLAALILISVGGYLLRPPAEDPPWANVTGSWGAYSTDGSDPSSWQTGRLDGPVTPLRLAAGTVQIAFRGGASMILEGPGELDVPRAGEAWLRSGRAVVQVPGGSSAFSLQTTHIRLASADNRSVPEPDGPLDSGCEFGAKSSPGGQADVQVYRGGVIAQNQTAKGPDAFPETITAGQAVRFGAAGGGGSEPIEFETNRFVRRRDLPVGQPRIRTGRHSPNVFTPAIHDSIVIYYGTPTQIDGRLDDWVGDAIRRPADDPERPVGDLSLRAMFDDRALYVAVDVRDEHAMRNQINPQTDGADGWRGGGFQVRVSTDRQTGWPIDANGPLYYRNRLLSPTRQQRIAANNPKLSHLTMWHHAATGRAVLHLDRGMHLGSDLVDPPGWRGAFQKHHDGRGYVAEYELSWSLLGAADDTPIAGDVLPILFDVHWADASGRRWLDHLVEVRDPIEPPRIYSWARAATWGQGVFVREN